jgi:beta-galactosidase/beta-glucuronidase
VDPDSRWIEPGEVKWQTQIKVPFAPECAESGVQNAGFFKSCWYRREIDIPRCSPGQRCLLHFGAIDYSATVWLNGCVAARHEGGYTPIVADISRLLSDGPQIVIVRAEDDPADLAKPRGKQDWQLEPHAIWYPRTTGIWQTVWLEYVPEVFISGLRWTPNLERWEIGFEGRLDGIRTDDYRLSVRLTAGSSLLAEDTYRVIVGEVHRRIALSDPGIDDYRNVLLWSPSRPTLINVELELSNPSGHVVDRVRSYTALRSIGVQGDRFVLNGRPFPLAMVLDQGYWPESGLTAPSDEHIRRDVEITKAMGFNGARKHQKIESPRYLYWSDVLGLLVWEEMPSAYRFTKDSVQRLTREWMEVILRDRSHPCVIAWVPFNESWGVPDLPDSATQRHYVQGLYHLTKTLDPTRLVVGNDGWESVATDIIGIHDYDDNPERIWARYQLPTIRLFERERPGGRLLLVGQRHEGQPIILTEFGGIALSQDPNSTWGHSRSQTDREFSERYRSLLQAVRSAPVLSGFCYTQFADTYQEANGLLYADRTPKFPMEEIALATRGAVNYKDVQNEAIWREQLMSVQRANSALPMEDHDPRTEPQR